MRWINKGIDIFYMLLVFILLIISLNTEIFDKKLNNKINKEVSNVLKTKKYFGDKNIKLAANTINSSFLQVDQTIDIIEKDRIEKERLEKERQARLEKERLEKERQARLEKERLEKERQARLEKERLEKERQARLEKEKQAKKNQDNKKTTTSSRVTMASGFYYEELSSQIQSQIYGKSFPTSFKSDSTKISYSDLRYLRVKYYDFNGNVHTDGELIVNEKVANEVMKIFYLLYKEKYPFTSIKLIDKYGADDETSMRANNTSCFNYRLIANKNTLSNHALGLAIDINPLLNPHVINGKYYPTTAGEYVDRTKNFKGKIDKSDPAYRIFKNYGWKWGGEFKNSKDYQHFEKR